MKEPIDLEALFPDRSSAEPLGAQFLRRLRDAIESGFFAPSSRLLPSRELARRLGLSRNTVTAALDQLTAEGYLEPRVGAGTFVTTARRATRTRSIAAPRPLPTSPGKLAAINERLDAVGSSYGPLRVGAPDLAMFPLHAWRRLERDTLANVREHLDYGRSSGLLSLREAISRHVAQFRGVVADPEQITIVEGTQGALHLIAFVVAACGDVVALEDPCYQYARAIAGAHALRVHALPVDEHGMRTEALPRNAAFAYVTPSHQFPLGGSLPLARRTELLDWAARTGSYIVEDDYDSEFCAHPLPALQSLDRDERVIYVGTFSKTLAPGLRIGYVVAPPHLAAVFRSTRAIMTLGASEHVQATLAAFIAHGHFSRHVRRMNATYERRRNMLIEILDAHLPRTFRIGPARTGLHVAVIGPRHFDDVGAAGFAPQQRVLPVSALCIEREDCRGLVLGFSDGTDPEIARAAATLARSLV